MKVGTEIPVAVMDVDEDGAGLGTVENVPGRLAPAGADDNVAPGYAFTVHVPGALPGEAVRARVAHVSPHVPHAWASLLTIDRPTGDRVMPACPAHGSCGGCVLQHWHPAAQLAWKERSLRARVAADPLLAPVPVAPAVASPHALGYRNNSKLVAARGPRGVVILGGYAARSHQVVDLTGCRVVEPALEQVAGALGAALNEIGVAPYDERRLTGVLRYAILRANAGGQVLVTLVTAGEVFPQASAVVEHLRTRAPAVTGVVHNVNPTRGNVLFGEREVTLAGTPYLDDRIGDVRLRVSSRAFFQANRQVAALAYQAIAAAVGVSGHDRVVDAYAGVGGIALTLAPRAARVWGIEDHPAAAADATISAALNGVSNATFVAGDAAAQLGSLLDSEGTIEIVVLNPPRRGCEPQVLRHAAALGPRRIAYLSCSPPTLLRDLGIFATLGYRTVEITPFDMLPHTPHLEALAVLERAPLPAA